MTLEQVVHRIATDSAFAAEVRNDPVAALQREGALLGKGDLEALLAALGERPGDRPVGARPWYEAQLGDRPESGLISARPWYEAQLRTDTN